MLPETNLPVNPVGFNGKAEKKGVIISIIAILLLAAAGVAVYFVLKGRGRQEAPPEDTLAKQMEELDKLRNPAYEYPTTTAEVKKQTSALSKLSSKSKPLSEEEKLKQLEELNKLGSQ